MYGWLRRGAARRRSKKMIGFNYSGVSVREMFHTVYLDEHIALTPTELNTIRAPDDIKKLIEIKLCAKHEGKCNANGYVRPDSVELLARSMGIAENGRFTGNLVYDCKIKCDVIYPIAGSEIMADVIKVNKMGAYVTFEEAIQTLLPRDLHIGDINFDKIKEGDKVKIRIERSRFQANDPFIMAVGVYMGSGEEAAPAAAKADAAAAEEGSSDGDSEDGADEVAA